MATFLMVDVDSVSSDVSPSNFSEAELDNLADMILASGGILKPLVLKKIGFEQYKVIDGHFEYYAAVRAREKDPSEAEMVNALIVSPENEEAVLKQVEALRSSDSSELPENKLAEAINLQSPDLAKIELSYEKQLNELRKEQLKERQKLEIEFKQLEDKIKQVENKIPKKYEPLEVFKSLNISELALRLRSAGMTDTVAVKIAESIEQERKKKQFESLNDVVERVKIKSGKRQVKGISSEKMVMIIDSWSRLLFI